MDVSSVVVDMALRYWKRQSGLMLPGCSCIYHRAGKLGDWFIDAVRRVAKSCSGRKDNQTILQLADSGHIIHILVRENVLGSLYI